VQVSPTVYDRDALAAYMASPERLEAVNDQMAVIKTALAAAALEVLDALVEKMEASAKTERVGRRRRVIKQDRRAHVQL
jgi:uncharacterized ferritin-like protein (DUF455 family)